MAEVRYRGTKVVTVSPDYADNTKFADEWMPAQAGTDAALAMAMGHVILKEFFVDRADAVLRRLRPHLHRPAVPHPPRAATATTARLVPGKFLTAADLAPTARRTEDAWKTVLLDEATGEPVVPNGSMGFRYAESGEGRWNLDLEGVDPGALRWPAPTPSRSRCCCRPSTDAGRHRLGAAPRRARPPRRRPPGHHGLRPDARPVRRRARRAAGRAGRPATTTSRRPTRPAWQAEITSVPAEQCIRIAREFAANAEESGGRSMIIMGAGICQWFHGDATYRAILSLLILTGCMGRNGGGWAHYVGQEKCRPITGWISLANALDWARPPRTMTGTSYWYMHTDQWRNDGYSADSLASPLAEGHLAGKHTADTIAQSARLGWMPFYPQFDTNPLDVADEARRPPSTRAAPPDAAAYVAERAARRQPAARRSRTSTPRRTGRARWCSGART